MSPRSVNPIAPNCNLWATERPTERRTGCAAVPQRCRDEHRVSAIPATFRAYVAEKIERPRRARRPRLRRGRPAPGRGRDPGRLVERQLQGRPGHAGGRQGRPDQPADPRDRPRRARSWRARIRRSRRGTAVVAHGYELGVSRHGGYAEYQRVPAGWVVPLAPGLSPREAMAIGTAGFTAAMSVVALEDRGLAAGRRAGAGDRAPRAASAARPWRSSPSVATRSGRRPARTTRPPRLRQLGASGILTRDEVTAAGRPLDSERWAGRGRRRRWRDAAVRPAHAADRGGRRVVRERRRSRRSRRPSSRSSCAASRCSAWTR